MTIHSEIVANHAAALIRGEQLPPAASAAVNELLDAMRGMLQSEAYPQQSAAGRNHLALAVITALNRRIEADLRTARAIGNARAK